MDPSRLKGMRRAGLFNEDAPDYGEFCSTPARHVSEAHCYSRECSGENAIRYVVIQEASLQDVECPRCGHALVWTRPGLRGKRQLRRRY